MTRVFNLQREPETGELLAIGKSERPYRFDEIRRAEAALARGDRRAWSLIVDVDVSLDSDGRPVSAELLRYLRDRLRRAGWPARASRLRRLQRWQREVALRQSWRAERGPRAQGDGSLEV